MMTLYSRIVDRTMRPMFPKGMINDLVITITPLSFDRETDLAILGVLGGSLATMLAGVPFDGPVSAVRLGLIEAKNTENAQDAKDLIKVNPSVQEFEQNGFNLLVSGKKGSLNMIEMDGAHVSEEMMESGFVLAQQIIDELSQIQTEFLDKARGKKL